MLRKRTLYTGAVGERDRQVEMDLDPDPEATGTELSECEAMNNCCARSIRDFKYSRRVEPSMHNYSRPPSSTAG